MLNVVGITGQYFECEECRPQSQQGGDEYLVRQHGDLQPGGWYSQSLRGHDDGEGWCGDERTYGDPRR